MHAVIRTYSGRGAAELFDLLENRIAEVETIMRSITGFASYLLVRTADGGTSVTVCQDKAGADESVRRAREWISQNAPAIGAGEPAVSEGRVILQAETAEPLMVAEGPRPA
jgi:hypothetical protein